MLSNVSVRAMCILMVAWLESSASLSPILIRGKAQICSPILVAFPGDRLAVSASLISSTELRSSKKQIAPSDKKFSWFDRLHQLIEYKEKYGDTLVPKRYEKNPSLGNWVNKQRQQYRKFWAKETPCSLNAEKVAMLNEIGFCWDANAFTQKSFQETKTREDRWWRKLQEYRELSSESTSDTKLSSSVDRWLRQQRQHYSRQLEGSSSNISPELDVSKLAALKEIDVDWWKSPRQKQWEERCRELIEYKKVHGDCCVPITSKKKKLANWVSNCRKQYNLRMAGERSNLSLDQIEELNKIGMVWDRWEFEYSKVQEIEYFR